MSTEEVHEPASGPSEGGSALEIVSLVFGIVALLLTFVLVWLPYIPAAVALVGLVTGTLARKHARTPMALAGLLTSAASLVLLVAMYLACYAYNETTATQIDEQSREALQELQNDPEFQKQREELQRQLQELERKAREQKAGGNK